MARNPVTVKITQEAPATTGFSSATSLQVTLESKDSQVPITTLETSTQRTQSDATPATESPSVEALVLALLPAPFRDPAWEAAEQSYLALAVKNLNSLTRSYNLVAPELAQKPYFNLKCELKADRGARQAV
ncbi:MAG: hypothetical protein M1818_005193 [Claussenomyces sp. TS43310]|nr:MAG: hypothetical protein M1818_005193 [Claussenomyces sp. TS43310]